VYLVNESGRTFRKPLDLVLQEITTALNAGMGLQNLQAMNADDGGKGSGATWTFRLGGGVLVPGGRTETKTLRFSFEGGVPTIPNGYFEPTFRVFRAP
jgi:hypothetical protein